MANGLKGYRKSLEYVSPNANWKGILAVLEHEKHEFPDDYPNVVLEFSKYAKHEVARSAYRLLRILSVDYSKATQLLKQCSSNIHMTHMWMLTPQEPSKVRIFINLKIDNPGDASVFSGACPYIAPEALVTLVTQINSEMDNPNAAKGWVPMSRGRGRLKKYEDMSIERALMRYSDARVKGYSEADIKKAASALEESRLPVKLYFAETPEQILFMYSSGPSSCMSATTPTVTDRPWSFMTNIGRHPCDFFAYHPYIRGVYTKSPKGSVTARTFLYKKADDKEYYGRIYGSDGRHATSLKNTLIEQGIQSLPNSAGTSRDGESGYFMRECEFRIPGILHKSSNEYAMPYPYLDNLRGGVSFKYDTETHEFIINCYNGSGYTTKDGNKVAYREYTSYAGLTGGYITQSTCGSQHSCMHCGGSVSVTSTVGRLVEPSTGHRFCSTDCLRRENRLVATLGDGSSVIAVKGSVYVDPIASIAYTTEQACLERGGLPYQVDPLVFEEENIISTAGTASDGLRFYDSSQVSMYNRRGKLNRIKIEGPINEFRTREIDFDRLEGVKFTGEIPSDYQEPVNDARFSYPVASFEHKGQPVKFNYDNPYITDFIGRPVSLVVDPLMEQEAA